MTHPILILQRYIAECASNIAPEKSGELEPLDLTLEINHDRKFSIRVNSVTRVVKLPIGALNYLWCSAYFFLILYNTYVDNQGAGAKQLDTAGNPRVASAIDLFNWAREALKTGDESWPVGAPVPADSDAGNAAHLANEMFLAALAWIIHHERAHIELGHGLVSSVADEMAADRNATKWILGGELDEKVRELRALGIAVAVLSMVLLDDPHFSTGEVKTHPPDLERLFDNISLARLPVESHVYSFCAVILQFCIAQYSVADAADKGDSKLDDLFRDFLVLYHQRHRR